ncbi:hypothetical protein BDV38DRAFT_190483 [Aspergillus pseudotamarii]|uniref:F-box domain-containing protein n=1 Tax=Aspergillus pseudotamarii TaxID=132259 RepID=A0A5N6T5W8_ASPPS|nr:uncharacterized protein BDV38DRAFT_190483 [Aspergillus pseudotamarii]KAE8141639.1 hypothetical protein BDV38DRAFT_190483 [Aspergillus pseudotamarii]
MGYWEVPCQFCGVSFNISRIRSKWEPRSAAFGPGGRGGWIEGRDFTWDEEDEEEQAIYQSEYERCSSETGCCMALRGPELYGNFTPKPRLYADDPVGGIHRCDPNYEYQSEPDNEPLEYDSEACDGDDGSMDMRRNEYTEDPEWTFKVQGPDQPEYDTEFYPLSTKLGESLYIINDNGSRTMNREAYNRSRCYEHIAGPDCRNILGYLGRNISTEEMRGCHTVQCILAKRQDWEPRPDDLAFERESQYHLTGVAEIMPSSGDGLKFAPVRHGVDNIRAETEFLLETSQEELNETGLPFHPACFELFIQASKQCLGDVDIDTLVRIRDRACLESQPFPIEDHEHARAGQEQCWNHNVGHEYLVANPIFVPSLKPIIESAISADRGFSVHNSPFDTRNQTNAASTAQDHFLALPIEIILIIIDHLDSREIAALRLVSRAFTHLPNSLWYRLVLREMPWLYEAWSSDPTPYHWATVIAHDAHQEKEAREEWDRDVEKQSLVIADEMPEVQTLRQQSQPQWQWPDHPDRLEVLGLSPVKLNYSSTNWYQLYRDITLNWRQLKGLQNRARIWDAITQIVGAIKDAREKRLNEGSSDGIV